MVVLPTEYAFVTGISINRERKTPVVFISTNDNHLDMLTKQINSYFFQKDHNETVRCVRLCSDDYFGANEDVSKYCVQHLVPKLAPATSVREKLDQQCLFQTNKLSSIKTYSFITCSITEIPFLEKLSNCSFIVLDADYISNVRLSGLIPFASQMILFCRKRTNEEGEMTTKNGIFGLATNYLVDQGIEVKNIHEPLKMENRVVEKSKRTKTSEPVLTGEYAQLTEIKSSPVQSVGDEQEKSSDDQEKRAVQEKPVEEKSKHRREKGRKSVAKEEKKPATVVEEEKPATVVEEEKPATVVEEKPAAEEEKKHRKSKRKPKRKQAAAQITQIVKEETKEESPKEEKKEEKKEEPKPQIEAKPQRHGRDVSRRARKANRDAAVAAPVQKENEKPKEPVAKEEKKEEKVEPIPVPASTPEQKEVEKVDEKKPEEKVKETLAEEKKVSLSPIMEVKENEVSPVIEETKKEEMASSGEDEIMLSVSPSSAGKTPSTPSQSEDKKPEEEEKNEEPIVEEEKVEEEKQEEPVVAEEKKEEEEKIEKPVVEEVKVEEEEEEEEEEKSVFVIEENKEEEDKVEEVKVEEEKEEPKVEEEKKEEELVIEEEKKEGEPVIEEEKKEGEPVIEEEKKEGEPVIEEEKEEELVIEEEKKEGEPVIEEEKKEEKVEEEPKVEEEEEEKQVEEQPAESVPTASEASKSLDDLTLPFSEKADNPTEIPMSYKLASSPDSTSNLPINPIVNSAKPVHIGSEIYKEGKQNDDSFPANLSSEIGFSEEGFNLPDQVTEISPLPSVPNVQTSYFVSPVQENPTSEQETQSNAAPAEASAAPSSQPPTKPVFVETNPLLMPMRHALLHNCLVCSTNTPLLLAMMQHPVRQQRHAIARTALRHPIHRFARHRRSCDIQVRPRQISLHELLQKRRRRASAAVSTFSHIPQIRHLAVQDFLLVFLLDRHVPAPLARSSAALDQLLHQLLVVSEESCGVGPQSHADRAGERADVHQTVDFVMLLHVRHRVRQNQPTLRVRIAHLHKSALFLAPRRHSHIERLQNRSGTVRLAPHHVLHRGDRRYQIHRRVHLRQRVHRAQHRRGAAHVQLHVLDVPRRLQIQPARVEADALSHDGAEFPLRAIAAAVDSPRFAYMYVIRISRGAQSEPWPTALMRFSPSACKSGAYASPSLRKSTCRTLNSTLSRSQMRRQSSSNERGFSSLDCSFAQIRAFTVPSPTSAP